MKKTKKIEPLYRLCIQTTILLLALQQANSYEVSQQNNINQNDSKFMNDIDEQSNKQQMGSQIEINYEESILLNTNNVKDKVQDDVEDRFLQQVKQEIETRDNSCHYTCSSCQDDNYYSCTSCFGQRALKETVHGEVSLCRCGINTIDEGPGVCQSSSNKNLDLIIKALFSSAFGINLFTSFVVWNPMYFLGFSEFSQVVSQLAFINKHSVLNFDEIADFITFSHINKIFMLRQASTSTIGRNKQITGPSDVNQNPKIYLNDMDICFIVNAITIVVLHIISWVIATFGRSSIKYKHLLTISTPLVIYLISFQNLNFLALFQFTTLHFDTAINTFGFITALFCFVYLICFTAYIFYYISIKQVLNEEKQTKKLKTYINELHQIILENPDHDIEDDASSKQSHQTNSKLNKNKQNEDENQSKNGKQNGAHNMILEDLNQSSHKDNQQIKENLRNDQQQNLPNSKDNSPINKDISPAIIKNDHFNYSSSKHYEADSTFCENDSPIKPKKLQIIQELNNKNKSSSDLIQNQNEVGVKVINLKKQGSQASNNQNEQKENQNEIRSIEEGLESNKQMREREEELKLKLIEQEFHLQQYRSMFYLFFILLRQSNLWQRGFFTALILRKFMFGVINLYVFDDPKTQMVLLLLVDIVYFCFCLVSRPFAYRLYNIFFLFFEAIALLCFIIFTSVISDDVEIETQISSIKAIIVFLIIAFIIYIIIGVIGVIFFIFSLIRGPKDPLLEDEEELKDKKSDEDDYSMQKKEPVKQNLEENASPGLARKDSPPILQQQESELQSPYKNKLIKPFKSESIVLLEADEEDDDDFNMSKKATNQKNNLQNISPSKPEEDERPDDHIRRPVRYQLTQIRKQADELFKQQKEQFERNREKRIAKTMILENEASSKQFGVNPNQNQDDYQMRNGFINNNNFNARDNVNNNNSQNHFNNFNNSLLNQNYNNDMSYHKNPLSLPYSFRNADQSQLMMRENGDASDRRILDEQKIKSQRTNRLEDESINQPNLSMNMLINSKSLMNSQREQDDDQNTPNPKREMTQTNKKLQQSSFRQQQSIGINSNNSSFYSEFLRNQNGNMQGQSEYQTPNNLSPRNLDNQNEPDFGEKFSPILNKRELQERTTTSKKLSFTPIKIESLKAKSMQQVENQSISNMKGIEDLLEQRKAFVPGTQQTEEDYQPISQKFQFKLQRNMNSIDQKDKNDQSDNKQSSSIFTKPFTRAGSKLSNKSKQNLDEIDSPIKTIKDQNQIKNMEENLYNTAENDNEQKSKPQTEIKQEIKNENLNPQIPQNIIQKEEQGVINLKDDSDEKIDLQQENKIDQNKQEEQDEYLEEDDTTYNIHNESYIPYDPDLKQYESQMNNIPQRQGKSKKYKSLIINNSQQRSDKLNNTQIHTKKPTIIENSIKEEDNNQKEDDFNNILQNP